MRHLWSCSCPHCLPSPPGIRPTFHDEAAPGDHGVIIARTSEALFRSAALPLRPESSGGPEPHCWANFAGTGHLIP